MNANGYHDNGYDHENRDAALVAVLGVVFFVALGALAAGFWVAGHLF